MIPFSPPRIDDRTVQAVAEALKSGWITTGPRTKEFERRLADYCGTERAIALNSWTNACELVLRWFGVGPGDEVIVPAYTYCATANIVVHVGARPVMVDVLDDFTLDPNDVERAITERTKCIIPVDIGGLPAAVDTIMGLARSTASKFRAASDVQRQLGRILVLSDAAHSFGARIQDRPVGSQADITGYSFHAVKNLTTAEGGALAFALPAPFDAEALYRHFNVMSLHGQSKDALAKTAPGAWRYDVQLAGFKCNMTDLQAAIGLVELDRYENSTLPRRKTIAMRYQGAFQDNERCVVPVLRDNDRESSYHLYMLRIKEASEAQRDRIIERIAEQGVSVNVHFIPLPMLSFYRDLGYRIEDFPKAYKHYSTEISLPIYYDLTDEQVEQVISAVRLAVNEVLS
ncbi:MAG: DegT/DnrJ/EryC1/StrS family aminotransferase [Flavobacteriales bacterium]|nr:DegT/DnrJ/EryC1/StrS family aminotransferase [Flavobacteriales bacterium]